MYDQRYQPRYAHCMHDFIFFSIEYHLFSLILKLNKLALINKLN